MISLRLVEDAISRRHRFLANGKPEDFKCTKCNKKDITTGFQCENDEKLILCEKCGYSYPMHKCKHNKIGEHRHIRFWKEDGE